MNDPTRFGCPTIVAAEVGSAQIYPGGVHEKAKDFVVSKAQIMISLTHYFLFAVFCFQLSGVENQPSPFNLQGQPNRNRPGPWDNLAERGPQMKTFLAFRVLIQA